MYILVKLNEGQGVNLGPNFTLTANVGTLSPSTATLAQLLAGVTVLANDNVTQVFITSQGICTNSLTLNVTIPTTTTTTTIAPTTTTTIAPATTTTTAAPTTTTTTNTLSSTSLSWYVGNQSGGNLKVLKNTGGELLNITSSAGVTQSGSLTIYSYDQPYTIRGSWVSGSGNIVKYRVCEGLSELYLSPNITEFSTMEEFTPTPVPLSASVSLTAQSVSPPPCAP